MTSWKKVYEDRQLEPTISQIGVLGDDTERRREWATFRFGSVANPVITEEEVAIILGVNPCGLSLSDLYEQKRVRQPSYRVTSRGILDEHESDAILSVAERKRWVSTVESLDYKSQVLDLRRGRIYGGLVTSTPKAGGVMFLIRQRGSGLNEKKTLSCVIVTALAREVLVSMPAATFPSSPPLVFLEDGVDIFLSKHMFVLAQCHMMCCKVYNCALFLQHNDCVYPVHVTIDRTFLKCVKERLIDFMLSLTAGYACFSGGDSIPIPQEEKRI